MTPTMAEFVADVFAVVITGVTSIVIGYVIGWEKGALDTERRRRGK
jgi:hypothetical protein